MLNGLRENQFKNFVVGTLFLPLLVFSFFSVGTMPAFSKQGIEIVICSGEKLETIIVDQNGHPIEKNTHTPCEWSLHLNELALSHADLTPAEQISEIAAPIEQVNNTFPPECIIHHKKARAPPPSV